VVLLKSSVAGNEQSISSNYGSDNVGLVVDVVM
jgi:hypothetical protein